MPKKDVERPWTLYKKADGSTDKLYQPGWAGSLGEDELERLQKVLAADPDLARVWGWRPSMKRRAVAAIERVAYDGSPDDIAHNRKLVRQFSKKAKEGDEAAPSKVKQPITQPPARPGRPRIESWESELLRMAASGMGVKAIAKALKSQGVQISHATVANRLREFRGPQRRAS
jgi:DNA-binding NarL/FixJ family response regulator